MSYGFKAHPCFEVVAAVDAEIGKPSTGRGALDCNATYEANIGIRPLDADLRACYELSRCSGVPCGHESEASQAVPERHLG
jgi:hypothetical protein